jgi:hypothetical protein
MSIITSCDDLIPGEGYAVPKPHLSGILALLTGEVSTDHRGGREKDQEMQMRSHFALTSTGEARFPLHPPDERELTKDDLQALDEGVELASTIRGMLRPAIVPSQGYEEGFFYPTSVYGVEGYEHTTSSSCGELYYFPSQASTTDPTRTTTEAQRGVIAPLSVPESRPLMFLPRDMRCRQAQRIGRGS